MSSIAQSVETNDDRPEDEDIDGVDIGKKHKLGHLRIDTQGNVTFKRLPITQLVEALQLGIQYTVGGLQAKAAHDVLYQDFLTVEIIHFPREGTKTTPAHRFNDFTIRSYAPVAFRHFRELFNIRPDEFLYSICKPLRELKNPGASGSLFYLTSDDEFILKTVQKKEAEFLKCLLPGYYMNVTQNPRTLLPKFFGLYCYQGDNKNIRITVMNNLIPSHVYMHEKYDLKGSTYKRRANSEERRKESPTWKDLDFMERHPDGLLLDIETYNALAKTVQRDCRVLESFRIMDYSFLIGVHHVDVPTDSGGDRATVNLMLTPNEPTTVQPKRMMYSTPMDTIQVEFDEHNKPDDHLVKTGGIPARTARGQRLLLYVGIIDILQSYQIRKKLEHTFKSVLTDGTQISVTNPSFYSERFQKFLFTTVFKKAPRDNAKKFRTIALLALRESPVKRRSRLSKMLQGSEQEKDMISTPITMRNDRTGLHTSPIGRRSFDITPVHLNQSATSSPKMTTNKRTYLSNMPLYANHASPNSSAQTQTASSHITSYYSSSPSTTRTNTFTRKPDVENNKRDSSTTVYSSSHQSDSLYNEPTKYNSAKILTTSFNNRLKVTYSPSNNRRNLPKPSIDKDNDDNIPRQILLPIGGGIVGKLASSAMNLSYHDKSNENSPVHRQYRNPSASGMNDDMTDPYIIRTRL
ncbi:unnamed protein product [Rotaria sordida]|uniref:PIPK domain-containing protein n=1 Tax=Rotaria sordida TaxID=392033 RepID=A0A814SL95_9BILA|nr:unnamed protein product [Rotaria sordida]CAF1131250.1 unnamed protein product [Rotaria sordida]CAF1148892.1 unnamed protein product [Rotaria sordida]CAF1411196.1 unnamed protein product [Rotaria sordida]CAF1411537.1 unnamed protein product [Rotaria sordida]